MNVSDIVSQVVAMLKPFSEKRDVEILFAPSSSPVISNVDPTQLEQVIVNLMVNAIQSMDSGALKISTTIDGHATRDPSTNGSPYACIEVVDNGIGMSEEQVTHIFDPFFTTKSQGQGTGMGLSIAQGIVVEHEGWITVTSKPGQGSCFSVFLPIVEG
jgi:signal transduction histidine kinase